MHIFCMIELLLQTFFPFIISAFVVILITVIAERYGTKVGGILGTIPSTIIIAFIFISLNKGVIFASKSASVVPAEMAINLIFLLVISCLAYRSLSFALVTSLSLWSILSASLYFIGVENIFISIVLYVISLVFSFTFLEKIKKIESYKKVKVNYTKKKIIFRGFFAGIIIAIAVFLSNIDPMISGIFSIFPAIFLSTMIITYLEHGPGFTAGMAKSMIFGSQTVMSYIIAVHFLYPTLGIFIGTIYSFLISLVVAMFLLKFREKIA